MIILVKCTLLVPVEIPDDDPDYDAEFDIEENHCPGTGRVGMAIDDMMDEADERSICWACNFNGYNEIIIGPALPKF